MITSKITILSEGNNRLTYETKKTRNDEDLARRLRTDGPTDRRTNGPTDQQTDKPAYRDARTLLKTFPSQGRKEMLGHIWQKNDVSIIDDDGDSDGDDDDRKIDDYV